MTDRFGPSLPIGDETCMEIIDAGGIKGEVLSHVVRIVSQALLHGLDFGDHGQPGQEKMEEDVMTLIDKGMLKPIIDDPNESDDVYLHGITSCSLLTGQWTETRFNPPALLITSDER